MKALTWETKRFGLADERELVYNVVGTGMPVLLLNGLGGSREIWAELVEHLQDRYCFITFDYSGLRNGMYGPAQAHTISLHARDAQAILQRESVARCAVVGWSMGVPVALELFAQAPSLVASCVCYAAVRARLGRASTLQSLPAVWLWRILRLLRRRPSASHHLLRAGFAVARGVHLGASLGLDGRANIAGSFSRAWPQRCSSTT